MMSYSHHSVKPKGYHRNMLQALFCRESRAGDIMANIPHPLLALALMTFAVPVSAQQPGTAAPEAYFIAEFAIKDRAAMQPYRAHVAETFAPFSGRFVARGGKTVSLEGPVLNGNIVVIHFDSLAQAQAWYTSPAYAPLKAIRHGAAVTRAYIVTAGPE
jgi:uncharacterized protein (DUF1330 family)